MARILLLGGTSEARDLAQRLVAANADAITSLAGRTPRPDYPGNVRIGGFGGAEGLTAYLRRERIDVLVDATHPFAEVMSPNAHAACITAGIPYLRLERPPWTAGPADHWREVDTLHHAERLLPFGARVFLAVGAQSVAPFLGRSDLALVVRAILRPDDGGHPNFTFIKARPPFALAEDLALFQTHQIEWIVAKNAGGSAADAKLLAARELSIPVAMVRRPTGQPLPDTATAADMMAHLAPHL